MKVKKLIMLAISFCICFSGISQVYKTEQAAFETKSSHIAQSAFRINPTSDDDDKNHIFIDEVEFVNKINSKEGIFYDKVSFKIVPKINESIVVFYDEYDSLLDTGGIELFITEDSMYSAKIPEFSWAGESKLREEDKCSETYAYINPKSKNVKDGEYILKINLLRYNNKSDKKGTETLAEVQEKLIVIDTTPPKIAFDVLLVRESPKNEIYSYFITAKNDFANNYDYMARDWFVFVNDEKYYKLHSDFDVPLPLIKLDGISENDKISVAAIDDLENASQKSVQGCFYAVEPVSIAVTPPIEVTETKQEPTEEEMKITYLNAVKNALSPFCKGNKLDLAEPFIEKYEIEPSFQALVDSYSEQYPVYICFDNGIDEEMKKIPVEISEGFISFALDETKLNRGTYQIFVSNSESSEVRLCKKQIYSSNLLHKIVTKTGFDGRSFLDVGDILFPASTYSFLEIDDLRERNIAILNSIVAIIKDNIDDIKKIEILGYANPEMSKKGEARLSKENEESLMPLSLNRAEYVRNILILLGIPSELMESTPCGGKIYEYNPTDKEVSYQNRRVRINLVRK